MTHTKNRVESRLCNKCGETKDITQRHKHATNTCDDCQRERAKQYQREEAIREGKRIGITGRLPYPLPEGYRDTGSYFKSLSSKTYKICDRDEWIKLLRERLEKTLLNKEVMHWINSHKDEPKPKKQKKIDSDYPDTRGITWDEYERGLGEEEVDS